MQKKKGISLIVLSITILVMVILAAAAVITLENSGIIGRSKNAVSSQQKSEEMTRLIVIKNGVLTDNLGTITIEEYVAELDKKGIIDGTTSTDEYGSTVVKTTTGLTVYIKQNGTSDLTISFDQITPPPYTGPTLGSLVTAADYGKSINYVSDNGVTEWNVFYHTEDRIYIIAKEKVAYDIVKDLNISGATKATATVGDKEVGQIHWSSAPSGVTVASDAKTKWLAEWSNYTTNTNGKCVSYFLDETIWTGFKNTSASYKTYIEGAIGTPTAEMFVASWNAKRATETSTSKVELTLSKTGTTGYNVNGAASASITTSDTLYIWSTVTSSSVWLASPSGSSASNLLTAYYSGYVSSGYYGNATYGVRPVVCLSSNIPAEKDVSGNFVI